MNSIKLFLLSFVAVFLFSCNSNKEENTEGATLTKEEMETHIKDLEAKLYGDSSNIFNSSISESVVQFYIDYVAAYPEDEKAPDYLFKAGEISMSMNRGPEAVKCFEQVGNNYPDYDKAPYSLFLQAFIFDNQMNDDKKAGEIYKAFIKKYPDHNMVKDAEFSIQNLGKTDEELIKEFEEKIAKEAA